MSLVFHDYYAGSGRADIEGGLYLIMPTSAGTYRASRSNGKDWVWEGGIFDTADLAKAACTANYTDLCAAREAAREGANV